METESQIKKRLKEQSQGPDSSTEGLGAQDEEQALIKKQNEDVLNVVTIKQELTDEQLFFNLIKMTLMWT